MTVSSFPHSAGPLWYLPGQKVAQCACECALNRAIEVTGERSVRRHILAAGRPEVKSPLDIHCETTVGVSKHGEY